MAAVQRTFCSAPHRVDLGDDNAILKARRACKDFLQIFSKHRCVTDDDDTRCRRRMRRRQPTQMPPTSCINQSLIHRQAHNRLASRPHLLKQHDNNAAEHAQTHLCRSSWIADLEAASRLLPTSFSLQQSRSPCCSAVLYCSLDFGRRHHSAPHSQLDEPLEVNLLASLSLATSLARRQSHNSSKQPPRRSLRI